MCLKKAAKFCEALPKIAKKSKKKWASLFKQHSTTKILTHSFVFIPIRSGKNVDVDGVSSSSSLSVTNSRANSPNEQRMNENIITAFEKLLNLPRMIHTDTKPGESPETGCQRKMLQNEEKKRRNFALRLTACCFLCRSRKS